MEELERKEPGGESICREGGADGELGGHLCQVVVRQHCEISDPVL